MGRNLQQPKENPRLHEITMMMPYSYSHIRRHELLRLSTLINNNLFPFTYFYVQFKNLFKKNVNINHKMFSLLIYARHEGTDHCRKKIS